LKNQGICLDYPVTRDEVIKVRLVDAKRVSVFTDAAVLRICPEARISVMGHKGECLASFPWREVKDAGVVMIPKEKEGDVIRT